MRLIQPRFWPKGAPKPWFWPALLAASALYALAVRLHKTLAGRPRLLDRALCVGNAIAGGAGKTPTLIALAALIGPDKIVFLTRGYGGSEAGPVFVDPSIHTYAEVGDEALLLARLAPVIVAKDRLSGYDFALKKHPNALILIDDGLQNPGFRARLNLLVWDRFGAGNGHTLPAGPLRQALPAILAKTDAVVALDGAIAPKEPAFAAQSGIPHAAERDPVLGFAGIGRPEKFEASLREAGYNVAVFHPFPDHHPYSEGEMEALAAHELPMLTTEKDHVRLPPATRALIRAVPYGIEIGDAAGLNALIDRVFS